MLRIAPRAIALLALAAAALVPAGAAAQPSQSDRSQTAMRVDAYEQHGGPAVLLCRHNEVGEQRHTCANTFSGGATMTSQGAGGALRTQIASWGIGTQWGEVKASVRTTFSGRLGVDLAGYTNLSRALGVATFHLSGDLHAYAIGETAFAQAQAAYTVHVEGVGDAPAQTHYPFRYECYLGRCSDRWSAAADGDGSGEQEDRSVNENRAVTLALAPGVLNSFDVLFDLRTRTNVSGGAGDLHEPPIWDANAGAHFQNTAGLASLTLLGLDAGGNPVDLSGAPITFSEGFGFLPTGPSNIPNLAYGPGAVTAAPEPGTWALLATGLLALGVLVRRRGASPA